MGKKTRDQIVRPIRLTEEEKRQQIAQILMQKREQFTLTILGNLLNGQGKLILERYNRYCEEEEEFHKGKLKQVLTEVAEENHDFLCIDGMLLVDVSVNMADDLMEKLYPIKEDTDGKQD